MRNRSANNLIATTGFTLFVCHSSNVVTVCTFFYTQIVCLRYFLAQCGGCSVSNRCDDVIDTNEICSAMVRTVIRESLTKEVRVQL
jgi:hypothetical protein